MNFDGITYAKGASVKQLVAYVGTKEFMAGLRQYFQDHAYANTTPGRPGGGSRGDLGPRPTAVVHRVAGGSRINTIRPEFSLDEEGNYASFDAAQTAPPTRQPPTCCVHIGSRSACTATTPTPDSCLTDRFEVDATGGRTPVPELVGMAQADLVLANDDDLTYCKLRLDERACTPCAQAA